MGGGELPYGSGLDRVQEAVAAFVFSMVAGVQVADRRPDRWARGAVRRSALEGRTGSGVLWE
jgi:hypothetical protein